MQHTRTPFAISSALLLAAMPLLPLTVQAENETSTISIDIRHYHITAGSLDSVLNRFALQAGIELSAAAELTRNKTSAGLNGSHSVADGLQTILRGSGLTARPAGDHYYVISAADDDVATLPAVTISASAADNNTEGTGAYATGVTNTATKLNLAPRHTPQIVNTITRQVIDDFAVQDMEGVLNLAPGISIGHTDDDRRNFTARGYPLAVQYDGLPSNSAIDGGVVAGPDSAVIDHVDVLVGAAGLMNGAGQPGGVVNMNYKRPTAELQASASLSLGSWDLQRTVADISGPLMESGALRARVVAVSQAEESFRDYEKEKKKVLYTVIEGDVTDSTLLSFTMMTQDIYDNVTDRSGLPTDNNGNDMDWDRSAFLAPAWNQWNKYATTYKLRLEQQLSSGWQMTVQGSMMESEADWLFGSLDSFDSTTGDATFARWAQHNKETSDDAEVFFSGPLQLFGRTHELVAGANWGKRTWDGKSGDGTDFNTNLYTFDPASSVPRPEITLDTPTGKQITEQYGVYVAGRFSLTDALNAIMGSRVSWYHYEYAGNGRDEDQVLTPYMGLVYDINSWASVYASYADIFNPQSAKGTDGNTLDPEVGASYETGIKGEFYNGRLNSSLAVFRIQKDKEALLISSIPYDANNACGGWCYEANGKTVTNGIDLAVSGEVISGLQLMAGFTQYKKDDNDKTVRITKLTGSYTLPGQNWTLGGSIDNSSKSYGQWGMSQDARTLVGLFGKYRFNRHVDVALNINNLFDKEYYANAIDSGYGRQYWGDPRSWTLTLNAQW